MQVLWSKPFIAFVFISQSTRYEVWGLPTHVDLSVLQMKDLFHQQPLISFASFLRPTGHFVVLLPKQANNFRKVKSWKQNFASWRDSYADWDKAVSNDGNSWLFTTVGFIMTKCLRKRAPSVSSIMRRETGSCGSADADTVFDKWHCTAVFLEWSEDMCQCFNCYHVLSSMMSATGGGKNCQIVLPKNQKLSVIG